MGFVDYPEFKYWQGAVAYVGPDTLAGFKDNYFNLSQYSDHSAAINAAITYVSGEGGGMVVLDEGTYTIPDSIAMANNVWLKGQGRATFLDGDTLATTEHGIVFSGDTDAKVSDLSIQTEDGGGKTCHCVFIEDGSDRFVVENVIIVDSDDNGIRVEGTTVTGGRIINCSILDTDSAGIEIDVDAANYAYNIHIIGNTIDSTGGHGIYLDTNGAGNNYFVITDNVITNGTVIGIYCRDTNYSQISGNVVHTMTTSGIYLSTSTYNDVSGNIVYNNTQHGIALEDSDYCIISNNVCAGNDSGDSATYDGINIDVASTHNVVSGNTCYGNHRYGIYTLGAYAVVSSNHCDSNDRHAIYIGGGQSLASNNNCVDNGQDAAGTYHGIVIANAADDSMIVGNYIFDTGGSVTEDGIHCETASHRLLISSNKCYNLMGSGICLIDNNDNNFIVANYCFGNDDYGVEITTGNAANTAVHSNYLASNVTGQLLDTGTSTDKALNWCGGPVYNSNGCGFATIALAVSDLTAGGWVEVPSGTWSEAVVLGSNDVTLRGQGWDSIIDGGTTGHAVDINGARCVLENIQVKTDAAGGNAYNGVTVDGQYGFVNNVFVNGSDQYGIGTSTGPTRITNCDIYDADSHGILINGVDSVVTGNVVRQSGGQGVHVSSSGDGTLINGNVIDTSADDGVAVDSGATNCSIVGNNIQGWTGEPVDVDDATCLVDANWGGGPVLTSKGCSMATIALALTYVGASGWVEVPSGTWNEDVTVSNNDVTLRGQGWDTIINKTADGDHSITVSGTRCVVRDLQCVTTPGGANNYDGVYVSGDYVIIDTVFVNGSDRQGIAFVAGADDGRIINCYIYDADTHGLSVNGFRTVISGNKIEQSGTYGIELASTGDDSTVRGNVIITSADDGIYIDTNCENCVVSGNRITAWTNEAIDDDSGTAVISSNATAV